MDLYFLTNLKESSPPMPVLDGTQAGWSSKELVLVRFELDVPRLGHKK